MQYLKFAKYILKPDKFLFAFFTFFVTVMLFICSVCAYVTHLSQQGVIQLTEQGFSSSSPISVYILHLRDAGIIILLAFVTITIVFINASFSKSSHTSVSCKFLFKTFKLPDKDSGRLNDIIMIMFFSLCGLLAFFVSLLFFDPVCKLFVLFFTHTTNTNLNLPQYAEFLPVSDWIFHTASPFEKFIYPISIEISINMFCAILLTFPLSEIPAPIVHSYPFDNILKAADELFIQGKVYFMYGNAHSGKSSFCHKMSQTYPRCNHIDNKSFLQNNLKVSDNYRLICALNNREPNMDFLTDLCNIIQPDNDIQATFPSQLSPFKQNLIEAALLAYFGFSTILLDDISPENDTDIAALQQVLTMLSHDFGCAVLLCTCHQNLSVKYDELWIFKDQKLMFVKDCAK
ncbi:MAG: hypothetical protein RR205_00400 [Oscillospiraceae bacterium]